MIYRVIELENFVATLDPLLKMSLKRGQFPHLMISCEHPLDMINKLLHFYPAKFTFIGRLHNSDKKTENVIRIFSQNLPCYSEVGRNGPLFKDIFRRGEGFDKILQLDHPIFPFLEIVAILSISP